MHVKDKKSGFPEEQHIVAKRPILFTSLLNSFNVVQLHNMKTSSSLF